MWLDSRTNDAEQVQDDVASHPTQTTDWSHRRRDVKSSATVRRPQRAGLFGWLGGLMLFAVVLVATTRFTELTDFAQLLRRAKPSWLFAALVLQAATYVVAARILQKALVGRGVSQPLTRVIPLGLAKLFTDQAIPSVGLSGTLLAVRGLEQRGVSPGTSVGAMLVSLVSYYLAYGSVMVLSIGDLWWRGELTRTVLIIATLFTLVATGVPLTILWFRHRAEELLPTWITKRPAIREILSAMVEAPPNMWQERGLIIELTLLQIAIFLLDASTLGVMLLAVATPLELDIVLASFVLASVAATLGGMPGGLGTFDGTCVAMLHWHGISLEAALAATLLLRGFTFWLPMLPGMWLARRELGRIKHT